MTRTARRSPRNRFLALPATAPLNSLGIASVLAVAGAAPLRTPTPNRRAAARQPRALVLARGAGALLLAAAVAASLIAALTIGLADPTAASPRPTARRGIDGLPLAAQATVSTALGADSRTYHVVGLRATNPAQRLRMRFSDHGVEIASGRMQVKMGLAAAGRGGVLRAPGPAKPRVRENRVDYTYGSLAEWFANGPRGLEQGFDVAAPPHAGRGPLTIALRISGAVRARLHRGAVLLGGDGASLRYGGLVATDANGHLLRSWLALDGHRLLIRVDDRGARYPLRIDPFVQQAELSDRHGTPGEELGEAIAVSGRTLVVGTIQYAASSTIEPGAAYVFTETGSGWAHARQTAVLQPPRPQSEEEFGRSVAISGDTIVVGAPFREVAGQTGRGTAYVFVRPASGWSGAKPRAVLTAGGGTHNEFFGESVAVAGNTVVVGAPGHRVGGHVAQGSVDVFAVPRSRRAGAARQLDELTAPDGQPNDALGISVAISGRAIVAGADQHRVGETAEQGAAYIFSRHATSWRGAREAAELTDEGGQAHELFGRSVAIWDDTVVVGAPARSGPSPGQGAAFVFVKPDSGWAGTLTDTAALTASDASGGDEFGGSLAVSGGLIVAGAQGHTTAKRTEQGAGYVFVEPAGGWRSAGDTAELLAAGGAEGDKLGRSVALSGDTILISAPDRAVRDDLGEGVVDVYRGGS